MNIDLSLFKTQITQLKKQVNFYQQLHVQYHSILNEVYSTLGNSSATLSIKSKIKNFTNQSISEYEEPIINIEDNINIWNQAEEITTILLSTTNQIYSYWINEELTESKKILSKLIDSLSEINNDCHEKSLDINSLKNSIVKILDTNLFQSSLHIENMQLNPLNISTDLSKFYSNVVTNIVGLKDRRDMDLCYSIANIKKSIKNKLAARNNIKLPILVIHKNMKDKCINTNSNKTIETVVKEPHIQLTEKNINSSSSNQINYISKLKKRLHLLEGQLGHIGRGNNDSGSEAKYYRINNKIKNIQLELYNLTNQV